jgi:hypothetical protein
MYICVIRKRVVRNRQPVRQGLCLKCTAMKTANHFGHFRFINAADCFGLGRNDIFDWFCFHVDAPAVRVGAHALVVIRPVEIRLSKLSNKNGETYLYHQFPYPCLPPRAQPSCFFMPSLHSAIAILRYPSPLYLSVKSYFPPPISMHVLRSSLPA